MPMVIPVPVTIADLADLAAPINVLATAQGDREVWPRDRLDAVISVVVLDDPDSPVMDNFTLAVVAAANGITVSGVALGGEHIAVAWDATGSIPVANSGSFSAPAGDAEFVALKLAAFLNGNLTVDATVVGAVITLAPVLPATAIVMTAGATAPGAYSAPVWVQEEFAAEWKRGGVHRGESDSLGWLILPV